MSRCDERLQLEVRKQTFVYYESIKHLGPGFFFLGKDTGLSFFASRLTCHQSWRQKTDTPDEIFQGGTESSIFFGITTQMLSLRTSNMHDALDQKRTYTPIATSSFARKVAKTLRFYWIFHFNSISPKGLIFSKKKTPWRRWWENLFFLYGSLLY
jgi:hypothetical protein